MNEKPSKPYPEFPLFAHATKRWAKKIRGKLHYFGPWRDPMASLNRYLDQRDDLHAGRIPRLTPADTSGVILRDLCNHFLTAKDQLLQSGELQRVTFTNYKAVCELLVKHLGASRLVTDITPSDLADLRAKLAEGVGLVTLGNRVRQIRTVFKFASDHDLIERPVKFGTLFKTPAKRLLRADRQAKPLRMFAASELRAILTECKGSLRAMVLLGINCGFGQTDCSSLPIKAVDLGRGWLDFPRPKTAVPRRCPLWPETVEALRSSILARPKPAAIEDHHRLFVTRQGAAFVRTAESGANIDGVAQEFAKLLKRLGLNGARRAFYALRHTFETIAGASRDQVAVDAIMGHAAASSDMGAVYREQIGDDRLTAVSDRVRAWLFAPEADDDQAWAVADALVEITAIQTAQRRDVVAEAVVKPK